MWEPKFKNPNWKADGVEPPETLKKQGFIAGYKPPAPYFNWFLTRTSYCIEEIQGEVNSLWSSYDGLGEVVGDTFELKTSNKTSVVAAINELAESSKINVGQFYNDNEDEQFGEIFNDYDANIASGTCSHAEGSETVASGDFSHAEGHKTESKGHFSSSHGTETIANFNQAVFGKYNTDCSGATNLTDTTGSIFIVGIGTSDTARSNAFRVSTAGRCYGSQAFGSSGADYAEFFEWYDSNPDNEDRRGLFVTLEGEKIRLANENDSYILGVVSATPAVCGDIQSEEWQGKYLKDVFGEKITEIVEVPESVDETTGKVIPAHTSTQFVINPNFDFAQEYISREDRREWDAIGLVGKLVVTDDGTCEVNKYCKVANGGTATSSNVITDYRVIERLDETHIRIVIK